MPHFGGDVFRDFSWAFVGKDNSGNPIKKFSCSLRSMTLSTMIVEELFSGGEVWMVMLIF